MQSPGLGAYDDPLEVDALDGEVVLRSAAASVAVALTPTAAMETARRLEVAAGQARGEGR
jgi:hypothetical protein